MSLRTDDIEGARPKYFERQKLIQKAQEINNASNIYSSAPQSQPQNVMMRNPDIYSSQVVNQKQLQNPQMQQMDNYSGQNVGNQGREKSMYEIEYARQSPEILKNQSMVLQNQQKPYRNPIQHYTPGNQVKMMSEKQYQEQLVIQEMKKFKDQQILIEQDKRRKELELREQDMIRKQKEQEQIKLMQQHQQEKIRIQKQQEEENRMREMREREQQIRVQEEIMMRDEMLKEQERKLIEQEQLARQRKSANVKNQNQQDRQFNPQQFVEDTALLNQINQQGQQMPINHGRLPSQNVNSIQGINGLGSQEYLDVRRTPAPIEGQIMQKNNIVEKSSPPKNARYFNTPLPSAYKQNNEQDQPVKASQLAAKSILSPMSAILQHNGPLAGQNAQMNRPKQKQVKVLAILDSDSQVRDQVNKFFQLRGISDFLLFCVPGSGAGLVNDKGWRDTFFSCFSFMRQAYDFSDIFIFGSMESGMIPFWIEQNNPSESGQIDRIAIKNFNIDSLKQSVQILQENVSQTLKISAFLLDSKGQIEKIV